VHDTATVPSAGVRASAGTLQRGAAVVASGEPPGAAKGILAARRWSVRPTITWSTQRRPA